MNQNPTFSQIARRIRESQLPADLKNSLLLLFYRLSPDRQQAILAALEKNGEALPVFAELLTDLDQNRINLTDVASVERTLSKYLEKLS